MARKKKLQTVEIPEGKSVLFVDNNLYKEVNDILEARGSCIGNFVALQFMGFKNSKSILGREDIFNFGKYYGVKVDDVIKNDLAYMYWLTVEQRSKKFKAEVAQFVMKLALDEGIVDPMHHMDF